ncbi:MAG: hypothetical protein JWM93_4009 [Frankiales bacterium]|nr:hypothetical protein [Frankiales bacterium]
MAIAVAATVPSLPAVPRTVTHVPVLRAEAVAVASFVYVVAAVVVTVTGVVVGLGVAAAGSVEVGRANCTLSTVKPAPLTAVTMPFAPPPPPPPPRPPNPDGRPVGVEPSAAGGRTPPGGRPPPPKPPGPAVQAPLTGALTLTVAASTVVGGALGAALGDAPAAAAALRTLTHIPTATSAAVPATVCESAVDDEYVTAVWLVVLWTCNVFPSMDASSPATPGAPPRCPPPAPAGAAALAGALATGVEDVAVAAPLLQAESARSPRMPTLVRTVITRVPFSVITECINGGKARGPAGGVDTGDDADGECDRDRAGRDDRRDGNGLIEEAR